MKVVQINAVYGIGSTGRIVRDISKELTAQGHEAYAFWAIECREDENASFIRIGNTIDHKIHALLRRLDGKQGWHSKAATKKACEKILEINPDVVHLHNLHSNYIHLPELLRFLGERNIPTLITLHDCWMLTSGCCTHYDYYTCNGWLDNCGHCPARKNPWTSSKKMFGKKKQSFAAMGQLCVNGVSKWTTQAAKRSMLKCAKRIECIYNWVDTDFFKPQDNAAYVREKYEIPKHHKFILGVSQGWSAEKGLDEFLLIAEALKDTATIILVGQDHGVPHKENLRCIGFTNDRQELVDLYSAADLLLNPSKAETFGLVTTEAMSCGTPVVAYNNSAMTELVAEQCGALAPNGDAMALLEQVKLVLQMGKEVYRTFCRQWACDIFDKNRQIQKYINLYYAMSAEREL